MNKNFTPISKHIVSTNKTENIYCYNNPQHAKFLYLLLHGYGQLAENFIEQFLQYFNSNEYYLVAPNALHHFYLKGGYGKIGASWMTSYNRELDIQDNNQYLKKVIDTFILPYYTNDKKIIVFGFSQGAPTLIRLMASQNYPQITEIVLWGAVFPPDVDIQQSIKNLKDKNWYYVIGSEDEYISEKEKLQQIQFFQDNKFKFNLIEYQGKHNIQKEGMEKLLNILIKN